MPSVGFGAAVFDHAGFNHAFVSGHLSYKTAAQSVGYALGFEKPFFGMRKLFVGAELHDLTASDDDWRVSSLDASLAAVGPRDSLRDYYRRRGIQLDAVFRPQSHVELLLAWRGERNESLPNQAGFSLWNRDENFRTNPPVAGGRLQALVVGASVDGAGFDRESLESTYRRHQLDTAFGERLPEVRGTQDEWRVDWQSEISASGALGSDFDFTRSIVSARARTILSPHQSFGARLIEGWSTGMLPPQRLFAVGGIGSVLGYPFKTQVGSAMTLVNLEYALGWRNGLRGFGLFDIGRTTDGGAVHLRLQAELWESRPVRDRLVFPALVRVFRISRNGTPPALTVVEPSGTTTPVADRGGLFATTLQLGRAERLVPSSRYYVRLVTTVGTIAAHDIDDVSDAVFGRQSDTGSATALGRFVLRSMLQLSGYLKSETSEIKSRKTSGADILLPIHNGLD